MAGLISDQLITSLRATAYKQLVTPVKVHRMVKVEGVYGTSEQDTVVLETMCWYKPAFKGDLVMQPGGLVANPSNAEFRFRWDTDIRVGDKLEVAGIDHNVVQDTNAGATISLYLKAWTNVTE